MTCYPNEVRADSPLGYWRFETSVDPTPDDGGLYPGTLFGTVTFGNGPGLIGSSAGRCSANISILTSDWVTFGDLPEFEFVDQAPFTLELWFKPSIVDNQVRNLITKVKPFTSPTNGWYLVHRDDGVHFARIRDDVSTIISDSNPLVVDELSYLVASYDGSDMRIYRNVGSVVTLTAGPTASAISLSTTTADVMLANHSEGAGLAATIGFGEYDEVAVYDTAIPLERLQVHYDERNNTDCTSTGADSGAGDGASIYPAPEALPNHFSQLQYPELPPSFVQAIEENMNTIERQLLALDPDNTNSADPRR